MTDSEPKQAHRRWYDHEPLLLEVLELLSGFQDDVRIQAEMFLEKIEGAVGTDALEKYWQQAQPPKTGNRWYDDDPVVFKAVELLRVVPPEAQRKAARQFLQTLEKRGIRPQLRHDQP